MIFPALPQTPS